MFKKVNNNPLSASLTILWGLLLKGLNLNFLVEFIYRYKQEKMSKSDDWNVGALLTFSYIEKWSNIL